MEEDLNVTYFILGGHVEVNKYSYLYFLTFLIVYLLIICSNCTIMYLIWKHQNLHEPMYIFIAALLLNSVLFSTNIYPKLLIDFLSDKQIISFYACLVQYSLFYALSSSEFLLLAAMAYDRYVSICKPLQYPTIMKKRTISIFLALAWLLPACQQVGLATLFANQKLCSFSLKVIFCNNTIYKLFCVTSRAITFYGLFILLNTVVFPVIFIVFTYTRILIICYHSCGEVKKKAAQTCLPHLVVLTNFFCLFVCDVITVRLEYDFPKTARLIMSLQLFLYNPLFNPFIYGLKMKKIATHLTRLFCQGKVKS
ncbi:Olfactory receptor 11A1 Hs6M1-18 Olfactory receptor 11A2 Olfactory receptor OR6-30 [Channa argus]|uniref:Olfactory receptor n=1 Tax=Channa argus TaxID=215402 RepID=A0A6G1PVV0_CHAAH|nr:Olfactory receptor 11A1 Hs6M1-18 Olfactory receptor 11A2 Olfactory receptor OR6-30 [Channa argus]